MNATTLNMLQGWLDRRLPEAQQQWLSARLALFDSDDARRSLPISIGLIGRRLKERPLALDDDEMAAALATVAGWDTRRWSLHDAARILLLCRRADHSADDFGDLIVDLARTASLGEAASLYRGVALYPRSDALDWQIAEGLRSNIRQVFEAIAHHNPYPADHFTTHRWNHMVLKALFVDSTLAPIQGLDRRVNAELADILCQYAHERWAAGRDVTPELWRCVGPCARASMHDDLARVSDSVDRVEQRAGLLAVYAASRHDASGSFTALAARLAAQYPSLWQAIESGSLDWPTLHNADEAD